MISWLPTYLIAARRFSLASMAFGASLPFLCALLGTNVFGFLNDRLSLRHDRTRVRRWFLLPYALARSCCCFAPQWRC